MDRPFLGDRADRAERRDRPDRADRGDRPDGTDHADHPRVDREATRPGGRDLAAADRFAYADGVRAGAVVWVAGHVARDGDGRLGGKGDAEARAVRCFAPVRAAVEAAGGRLADAVRATVSVTERAHRDVVNAVRGRVVRAPDLAVGTPSLVAGLALPEYPVAVVPR